MGCLILVFLFLTFLFVGFGFALHLLWIIAAVFFVFWVAGLAFGWGRRRGEERR